MSRQAVILAAGCSSRLGALLNGEPKCLLQVGGSTLIEHQIEALRAGGIRHIAVVVGHGASYVRRALADRCVYIVNDRYDETNSLQSLWLARAWIRGPFVMINSDVLAHPEIYRRVLARTDSSLAYDSTSGHDAEHMKVSLCGDRICAISKSLEVSSTNGESVGLVSFDSDAAGAVLAEADHLVRHGDGNTWAPAAIQGISSRVWIRGVDVAGLPWAEIDYREDLLHAREHVWPAIMGASSRIESSSPRALATGGDS